MVRLKFDDVKKAPKVKKQKALKQAKNRDDSDFDSEAEYGNEDAAADSSEGEYDDGKGSLSSHSARSDDSSSDASAASDEEEAPEAQRSGFDPLLTKKYQIDPFLVRREAALLALLKRGFHQRCIIFYNQKAQCRRAHLLLSCFGLKCAQIHGNMSQTDRMVAIEKFQRGEVDYLLATDLVARGLDISNVKSVLNF